MSSGKPTDWKNTKEQLLNPSPVSNNETWLGHRLERKDGTPYQAAKIDLMVLEGKYTVEEIAMKNNITVKRVEDHLEHLQDGDSRNKNTNMNPHKLKIAKDTCGVVMFSSESSSCYKYSDVAVNNDVLPTKVDIESAYRMLSRLGESISIDAVLDQIEINITKDGHALKSNWRKITEENMKICPKKGGKNG